MRHSGFAIVLTACALLAACENGPVEPDVVEHTLPGLNHHRPGHAGGGSGGGEDPPATFELTMTGAITSGPQSTTMNKETNRKLNLSIPSAQFVFSLTHAAAVDEITNPANPICEFRPSTMDLATKQELVATLQATRGRGVLVVNKFNDLGNVVYANPTDGELWTSWGFNTQTEGQQAADVTYDGTNKQDAGSTRHFRLNGGVIRVVNPEMGDIVCNVQDEMLAVVSPEV